MKGVNKNILLVNPPYYRLFKDNYTIEKLTDRLNRRNRIKGLISFDTVGKIKRSGLRRPIKKAINIFGIR